MSFKLVHTRPDSSLSDYPTVSDKADAARYVEAALIDARVPLAGIIWRQIARGLMESPTGETVLGVQGNNFTIVQTYEATPLDEDTPCTNPWCKDEPYHSEAEHIDPPDRDPNSDAYRDAMQRLDEAMLPHEDALDLLATNPTGPEVSS